MSEAWLHFASIISVQFLLFIFCAFYEKKLSHISRVLGQGILTGLIFGLAFDLIVGKFLGFHSYLLGFGVSFLILNAALSYGIFAANILLLKDVRLVRFYIWTLVIVTVYEITNHFFRVWTWEFSSSPFEFLIVLLVGYLAGAILIIMAWHLFIKYRFLFVDNLLHKTRWK
jgi:hypothetical protein